jgi:hypothetical protein
MKQYIIDELRPDDFKKIKAYLDKKLTASPMEGLYWMPLEKRLLSSTQKKHHQCQPFYVALELSPAQLSCEFLIRTQHRVRCDCIEYASETQRNWIIASVDAIFEELEIHT